MTQSVQVLDRTTDAADVAGAVAALAKQKAAKLAERLAPVLEEGEQMPDLELLFKLLGRTVQGAADDLDEADANRWVKGMELLTLQQHRRKAKETLRAAAVRVRKIMVELYGSKRLRFQFSLGERTPRGVADLLGECATLVRRLGAPGLKLPVAEAPGLAVDPKGWVQKLRPRVRRVKRLSQAVELAKIASSDAIIAKNEAIETFDETYLTVSRTLEALLALGGEKEMAERLRAPARWRARRKVGPVAVRSRRQPATINPKSVRERWNSGKTAVLRLAQACLAAVNP